MTIGARLIANCEARRAWRKRLAGLRLANQGHHYRDRQQTHRGKQNVVAPAGKGSKHVQSPNDKITEHRNLGAVASCLNMSAIRYSSTSLK